MTVNSSSSVFGTARRKTASRLFAALFTATLLINLFFPSAARAAEVTSLDTVQVAVSLEGTATTIMTMTAVLPAATPLPATFNFALPGGYSIIQQGEFDSDPSKPTAQTTAIKGVTDSASAMTTYSVTLSKSHNYFLAATMPVSIYNESAMGSGGVPLASFTFAAATDIGDLVIGLAPPATNMVGAGDSSMKTFTAGTTKLYGQEFKNVKKGDSKAVQVAFATSQEAQTGQQQAQAEQQAAQASGFFAQPIVWVLGAVLVIVIIILITVIMRQRNEAASGDADDWDDADNEDAADDDEFTSNDEDEDEEDFDSEDKDADADEDAVTAASDS